MDAILLGTSRSGRHWLTGGKLKWDSKIIYVEEMDG